MKIILLTFVLGLCVNINAQLTFTKNFLGYDCLPYKGVKLTLKENPASNFMYKFYSDLSYCQSMYDKSVLYPKNEYGFVTSKDSLRGRIFLVKDIIDKTGNSILKITYSTKPIFILEDTLSKQIIYFKYEGKYDFTFPFLTSKIELNKKNVCSKITRFDDDMTDEIILRSPLSKDLFIQKNITSKITSYYLGLNTKGPTAVVDGSGVIILFTDGTKMTKSVKIDVDAGSNGFDYSTLISLTQKDLEILSANQIKKFRLYIFDQDVKSIEAEKFTYFVKCIMEMK